MPGNLLGLPTTADDYSAFNAVWDSPEGGLHGYLVRFLESDDSTFQHIAVWTCVQLLESGDAQLEQSIRSSPSLLPLIQSLAAGGPDGSIEGSEEDLEDSGEGEIAALARKVTDLLAGSEGR